MADRAKKPRYQGYNVDESTQIKKEKGWFWKVLGLSLVTSFVIIGVAVLVLFHKDQQVTQYVSKINDANTMENLLKEYDNVRITKAYSHLVDKDDYRTIRQVEKTDDDGYYSYLKTEGTDSDYKEVIRNEHLYRNDGNFTTYYGLTDSEYEEELVPEIEEDVFQINSNDKISEQRQTGDVIKLDIETTVQEGDTYNTKYGFDAGTTVKKTITLNKDSDFIMSETEAVDDEEFFSYTLQTNVEKKVPKFYKALSKTAKTDTRTVTVYYDYNGDDEKTYTYTFAQDVYFDMLNIEGYTLYLDADGLTEFTEYQMQSQNPESDLILYAIKESE